MSKEEYFNQYESYIAEKISLTDETSQVENEIYENMLSFTISKKHLAKLKVTDFISFLSRIKKNRKSQINVSQTISNLIYYIWFDEMAGQLRLNFINSNHSELPFEADLEFTSNEVDIIDEFLHSEYLNEITWDKLSDDTGDQQNEKSTEIIDFKLKVYREIIRKDARRANIG
ncbi:hypothetical protein JM79_2147 [Gramella sp. Hel_I_59]|uniref:hypothetical protein n=1 Tax=Gramella sp. Hel_I_59 TaxID=1249978 RepID=UPI001153DDF2|nr:hypothetical protein [Gramella sp. Hel_I_59]TQI71170.1 hypothetical protein JM79_2097 [Gramella sp. Hel_I_59]TQI71220.1 hypothetical protein JM79_2147 [Gramella sp. Hel_I_59]